jgi:hypothetical protein
MQTDKPCVFCGNAIEERAKEHVVAQQLQDALDLRKSPVININYKPLSGDFIQLDSEHLDFTSNRNRNHPATSLLAGRVCKKCNCGWMSKLEDEAKPLLLPLIQGTRSLSTLDSAERLLLARWTAKTAYAWYFAMGEFGIIPDHHPLQVQCAEKPLAEGAVVFGCQRPPQSDKQLGHCFSANWQFFTLGERSDKHRDYCRESYKASVQIGFLHLMVSYAVAGARVMPLIGVHQLIFPADADSCPWADGECASSMKVRIPDHYVERTWHHQFHYGMLLTDAPKVAWG